MLVQNFILGQRFGTYFLYADMERPVPEWK